MPKEKKEITRKPTTNLRAYDLYLKGLFYDSHAHETNNPANLKKAAAYFQQAISEDSTFAEAYARMSMLLIESVEKQNDTTLKFHNALPLAYSYAQKSLCLQPDLAEGHVALGYYHYVHDADYQKQLVEYQKALEIILNDANLLSNVADVYEQLGSWDLAVENLMKSENLDPRTTAHYVDLGGAYVYIKKYKEAIDQFHQALALEPDNGQVAFNLAWTYLLYSGNLDAAKDVINSLPPNPRFGYYVSMARLEVETYDRDFKLAMETADNMPAYLFGPGGKELVMGYIYQWSGKQKESKEILEKGVQILLKQIPEGGSHPVVSSRLLCRLGHIYALLNERRKAIEYGEKANRVLSQRKDNVKGETNLEVLAESYAALGDAKNAVSLIQKLLKLPGNNLSIYTVRLDPIFDPIRNDPVFQNMVADKINL